MIVNEGEVVFFEEREFRHCKDKDGDTDYDTWVLKSKGNVLRFKKEGFYVEITTVRFPNGFYGFGYNGTALRGLRHCYCHGKLGHTTFNTEFGAQVKAVQHILEFELPRDYYRDFIRNELNEYINPKSLF